MQQMLTMVVRFGVVMRGEKGEGRGVMKMMRRRKEKEMNEEKDL